MQIGNENDSFSWSVAQSCRIQPSRTFSQWPGGFEKCLLVWEIVFRTFLIFLILTLRFPASNDAPARYWEWFGRTHIKKPFLFPYKQESVLTSVLITIPPPNTSTHRQTKRWSLPLQLSSLRYLFLLQHYPKVSRCWYFHVKVLTNSWRTRNLRDWNFRVGDQSFHWLWHDLPSLYLQW